MVIQARKRILLGFLVAALLAWCAASLSAQVYVSNGCKGLTSEDWMWWMRGCYLYAAYPVDFEHRGFIVR